MTGSRSPVSGYNYQNLPMPDAVARLGGSINGDRAYGMYENSPSVSDSDGAG